MTAWQKTGIACASIGAFIITSLFFNYVFEGFETDSTVSSIMSVISGLVVVWIILSVSGILKEFSIKGGPLFELKAKMNDIEKETRDSNKEICGKINNLNQNFTNSIQNLNNRMDTVVTNISNNTARAENKTINNYLQTKGELKAVMEDTGISDSEVKKGISLSKIQQKKIDEVLIRLKTLEDSLEQPVKLTVQEMMRKAKEYAERGLTIIPKNKSDKNFIVACNLIFGDYIKASELSEELLQEYGDEADILYNYACARIRLGDKKVGLELLKKSILIDPQNIESAKLDPDFDSIRDNEEFQEIIKS